MSELICKKCKVRDCECVPYDVECDSCHRAYQQGKADGIDMCIALFREWQPRLATNVAEFGDALEKLKGAE